MVMCTHKRTYRLIYTYLCDYVDISTYKITFLIYIYIERERKRERERERERETHI